MSATSSMMFEVDSGEGDEMAGEGKCHSVSRIPKATASINATAYNTSDDVMATGAVLYRQCMSAGHDGGSDESDSTSVKRKQQFERFQVVSSEEEGDDTEDIVSWPAAKLTKELKQTGTTEGMIEADSERDEVQSDTELTGLCRPGRALEVTDETHTRSRADSPKFLRISPGEIGVRGPAKGRASSMSADVAGRSEGNGGDNDARPSTGDTTVISAKALPKENGEPPASTPATKEVDLSVERKSEGVVPAPTLRDCEAACVPAPADPPAVPVHPSVTNGSMSANGARRAEVGPRKKKGGFFTFFKRVFTCGGGDVMDKTKGQNAAVGDQIPVPAAQKAKSTTVVVAPVAESEKRDISKAKKPRAQQHKKSVTEQQRDKDDRMRNKDSGGVCQVEGNKEEEQKTSPEVENSAKEEETNINVEGEPQVSRRGSNLQMGTDTNLANLETDQASTIPEEEQESTVREVLSQQLTLTADPQEEITENSCDLRQAASNTPVEADTRGSTSEGENESSGDVVACSEEECATPPMDAEPANGTSSGSCGAFSPQSVVLCSPCAGAEGEQCDCRESEGPDAAKDDTGDAQTTPKKCPKKPRPKWSVDTKKGSNTSGQSNKENKNIQSGGGSYAQLAEKRLQYLKSVEKERRSTKRFSERSCSRGSHNVVSLQTPPRQLIQFDQYQSLEQSLLRQRDGDDGTEVSSPTPADPLPDEKSGTFGSRIVTPTCLPRPKNIPEFMNSIKSLDNTFSNLSNVPKHPCSSAENFSWDHFKKHFYLAGQQFPDEVMNDEELREVLADLSARSRPSCAACRPAPSELWLLELLTGVKSSESLIRLERESLYQDSGVAGAGKK